MAIGAGNGVMLFVTFAAYMFVAVLSGCSWALVVLKVETTGKFVSATTALLEVVTFRAKKLSFRAMWNLTFIQFVAGSLKVFIREKLSHLLIVEWQLFAGRSSTEAIIELQSRLVQIIAAHNSQKFLVIEIFWKCLGGVLIIRGTIGQQQVNYKQKAHQALYQLVWVFGDLLCRILVK